MGKKLLSRALWYSGPMNLALGLGLMADGTTVEYIPVLNTPNKEYLLVVCRSWPYDLLPPGEFAEDCIWSPLVVNMKLRLAKP